MTTIVTKASVGLMTLALAFSLSVNVAGAQTSIEDLQALIAQLQAQIAALQGGQSSSAPASCAGITFSRNLTIGSTGSDVQCLQALLNQTAATQVADSGPGAAGSETTYFGSLTADAVSRFQVQNAATVLTPLGLSSGTGFVGSSTRAALNNLLAATPAEEEEETPAEETPAEETPTTGGTEGTLTAKLLATPIGVQVQPGEDNKAVAGFELEAKTSEIRIQRVDVKFENKGTKDKRPWKYFDRIALEVNGSVVSSRNISSTDDFTNPTGNEYVIRFSGMNENIAADTKATVRVLVNAKDVIDSADLGTAEAIWNVTLAADAVRGVDGAGINQTAPATATTARTFHAVGTDTGVVTVTENTNNLAERVVHVDDSLLTNNVEVLAFDVKSEKQSLKIETLKVKLDGGTATASNIAPVAKLYQGTTLVGSVALGGATADEVVTFSDLEVNVAKDSTSTLFIKVDLNPIGSTTYSAGDTLTAALPGAAAIAGEDGAENSISKTASTAGKKIHLYEVAPIVSFSSGTLATRTTTDQTHIADGTITFTVKAEGGDVYVALTGDAASGSTGTAITASTFHASGITTAVAWDVTNATAEVTDKLYKVINGQTATFTSSVVLTNVTTTTGGFSRGFVNQFTWSDVTDGTVAGNGTTAATDWSTSLKMIEDLKTPQRFLTAD